MMLPRKLIPLIPITILDIYGNDRREWSAYNRGEKFLKAEEVNAERICFNVL